MSINPEPRRPRISVVNDNADFLELMAAILSDESGYDVSIFSGSDGFALAELRSSDPDLLIIDLLLGGASGWEIVTLSRADEALASVPIIVCSADVAQLRDRAEELASIGNVHILSKPFGIDDLLALVDEVLGGSPLRATG